MPATPPTPDHLPVPGLEDPWLAEDPWLDEDPEPPSWVTRDAEPPPLCLPDDLGPDDPERIAARQDREPAEAAPWLADDPWLAEDVELGDPGWRGRPPAAPPGSGGPVEVFKAGRWDRSRGDGGGFAAGGLADQLPPGPVLAGLAGDRWAAGLGRLRDDELIGVLRAARRLASWATAMELAAVGDLWQRRTAEENAGDTGAAAHADAELAAALTLTRRAADQLLNLAAALHRLPATRAALAVGDIDLPRAKTITDELTGLTGQHAAAVEQAVIGAAPGQTTGQLRAATHRAVLAADPTAARTRKEQALREARVERWTEPAGTAALAGRDLPPAGVLAADANLTALAKQLKTAGAEGTLDTLRAQIYLALLSGIPPAALLPATTGQNLPGDTSADCPASGPGGDPADSGGYPSDCPATSNPGAATPDGGGCSGVGDGLSDDGRPGDVGRPGHGGWPGLGSTVVGRVNLTVPLATWLGQSDAPGHVPGYGPLDATDARTLADALAAQAGTRWCLTFTGPDGRPLAHGCTRTGPPPGPRQAPPGTRSRAGPQPRARAGPSTRGSPTQLTLTITPLTGGCDHALETPAYQPTPTLRHLVGIRHNTCVFPGCRRPAGQCDDDHTIPYDQGGRTCLCNLAPLCRKHHRCKQAEGWRLEHPEPGVLVWQTPAGRTYTITPTEYPV